MKWIFTTLLLLISLPLQAQERGFDKPSKVRTREIGLSQEVSPPEPIKETCQIYQDYALVWREDPAVKGIEKVTVRSGKAAAELCAPNFSGVARALALPVGWPIGVAGPYLFVQDEPLGNMANFYVLELAGGKKVFDSTRDTEQAMKVEKSAGKVGLNFWMGLKKLACSPMQSDPTCWERIKKQGEIPSSLSLREPNCESAYKKEPLARTEPRALAISVPVGVGDLAQARVEFKSGSARCEALP